jgi:hypothetical protein
MPARCSPVQPDASRCQPGGSVRIHMSRNCVMHCRARNRFAAMHGANKNGPRVRL